MTFTCTPYDDNLELFWIYITEDNDFGSIEIDNLFQSKFLSESPLLHQLILPIATINDTGNYTCIVKRSSGDSTIVSQTISLTVLPGK